jgi:hypothetical protein
VGQEKKPCVIAPLRPLSNDGQTNHIPVGWGTRAPGGLGMQVGVQSNPSMTMSPQGRGIRRRGHHLPGCISDIAKVPNTRFSQYLESTVCCCKIAVLVCSLTDWRVHS